MKSRCLFACAFVVVITVSGAVSLSAQSIYSSYSLYGAEAAQSHATGYSGSFTREPWLTSTMLNPVDFDVNHDGKLDDQEYAVWLGQLRIYVSQRLRLMKKYDLNHDGDLDDVEWAAACAKILGPEFPGPAEMKK
ncbi:MAG TPA: hypothetical protein VFJ90_08925 [Candidatus Didemnitutus sp.]|nr:hypothetical protein [Candidatus Didemnitutus sp.]